MTPPNRSVAVLAVPLVLTLILAGCDSSRATRPTSSPDVSFPTFKQETDTLYWVNDVLEFTDENGNDWRFERDQEAATEVVVARNDTTVTTLEFEWNGTNVEAITATEPEQSFWVTVDTTGTIVNTAAGSAPPRCGFGGPCTEFVTGECDDEWDELIDAGNDVIAAGLVASMVGGVPLVGEAAAAYLAVKVADWGGKMLSLAVCLAV